MLQSQGLAYVALAVAEPDEAAARWARDFDLPRGEARHGTGAVPLLGVGATALALFPLGHPLVPGAERPGVHHIALAVDDAAAAARACSAAGVAALGEEPARGLGGAELAWLDPAATQGVRTALTTPIALPQGDTGRGDGPVERLDHLGVACDDNDAALAAFVTRLGLPLESTQTDVETRIAYESFTSDRYGVVHHTREPEVVGGLRAAFVTVGDCELEFLQELDGRGNPRVDAGAPGTTQQDYGAIAGYVARRGAGLHHLAFKVAEIDPMLARLAEAGHAVIDRTGRPGGRRSLIGFIHPRTLGGVLLHLVQRDERPPEAA